MSYINIWLTNKQVQVDIYIAGVAVYLEPPRERDHKKISESI